MSATVKSRLEIGALAGNDRDRFLHVCGLLARPGLGENHAETLCRIFDAPGWKPLPRLSATYMLEPLFTHHLIQLGEKPERLFETSESTVALKKAEFDRLAMNYFLRRRVLVELFAAFAAAGVSRVMLIKGAGLAPLYPSPALRDMEDVDLVVAESDIAAARKALFAAGWSRRDEGWIHANDCALDLLTFQSERARGIWERAELHPTFNDERVVLPSAADHLVLIAVHAAKHRGLRIWRDLCDVNLLLENGARSDIAHQALALASEQGVAASLAAMLRLLNAWSMPVETLPESPPSSWSEADEQTCRMHMELYEQLMVDRISEFGFIALANVFLPFPQFCRSVIATARGILSLEALRRRRRQEVRGQRDPALGEVPPVKTVSRQWMKVKVVAQLLKTGQFRRYRQLLRHSNRVVTAGKTFLPVSTK